MWALSSEFGPLNPCSCSSSTGNVETYLWDSVASTADSASFPSQKETLSKKTKIKTKTKPTKVDDTLGMMPEVVHIHTRVHMHLHDDMHTCTHTHMHVPMHTHLHVFFLFVLDFCSSRVMTFVVGFQSPLCINLAWYSFRCWHRFVLIDFWKS